MIFAPRAFSWLFLVIMVLVVTACGKTEPPVQRLRLGCIEWPGFYHIIALSQQTNTHFDIRVFPDNPTMNAALAKGEVDATAGVLLDALVLAAHGTPLSIVAAIDYSNKADVILARPEINQLTQLTGKRISFEGVNSFSHLFVLDVLAGAQISESSIKALDLSASEVPKALVEGRIDAGHTWGPLAEAAVRDGYRVLATAGDRPGSITEVLAIRNDVISARRSEVQAMVDTLFAAQAEFAHRETDLIKSAATVLAKSAADLSPISDQVVVHDRATALARMVGNDELAVPTILRVQASLLRERGQLPTTFSELKLIDESFIRKK
jgi:NitT/TauT family transport system substrate-binding protein